ncbi:MAG: radical SAM protein [Candidatus Solibacter usitatus]|nr:radical SAM protein [Candidatus Solibacter usitatus]
MFSGIARLAREGGRLEQKARVEYLELPARRLLNRCAGEKMPFEWTINPYRGCEYGCKYCYARYTHEFMEYRESLDFERKIFAKRFDGAAFAKELRAVKPGQWIAIGTATDPYQPAERRYGVTRGVLEVFRRRGGFRLAITTKSDLIARDAELLREVAAGNQVRVSVTVTTTDARLARLLEPLAPRPELRLGALRTLAEGGIETGVLMSPVMPGINDAPGQLEGVAAAAAQAGARHFGAQPVFLRECALAVFLPFLASEFSRLAESYRRQFRRGAYPRGEFEARLRRQVEELKGRYGWGSGGDAAGPGWGQLGLFDGGLERLGIGGPGRGREDG